MPPEPLLRREPQIFQSQQDSRLVCAGDLTPVAVFDRRNERVEHIERHGRIKRLELGVKQNGSRVRSASALATPARASSARDLGPARSPASPTGTGWSAKPLDQTRRIETSATGLLYVGVELVDQRGHRQAAPLRFGFFEADAEVLASSPPQSRSQTCRRSSCCRGFHLPALCGALADDFQHQLRIDTGL